MSIHDGHRERLKKRFYEYGLDSFSDINVLEMLLFYSIPRRDTNEIAHRLLKEFGSLDAVFRASVRELQHVEGVGYNSAILINFVSRLLKKIEMSKTADVKIIKNSKDAGNYFLPRFVNEPDEILYLLALDGKRAIISCTEMARGSVNTVDVNVRRVIETALKEKAVSIILAHNHPGGVLLPSKEDDFLTGQIYKALRPLGILLEDHIIVAGGKYISFSDAGIMNMMKY